MFPIRRPCADAVRSGISVLWSNSNSALYFSSSVNNGRFLIKPVLRIPPCPPALNQVLREYASTPGGAAAAAIRSPLEALPPLEARDREGGSGDQGQGAAASSDKIQYAAASPTPKGKINEREVESEATKKDDHRGGGQKNDTGSASGSSPGGNPEDKPGLDVLQKTFNVLQKSLEQIFTHPMNYTIYHPDIVFIDNIRHKRTHGLAQYMQQVVLLKTVGHVKFAYVRFEILNMSMCQEEGRITVRWRIKGLSGLRVMLKFWKYKLWKWQEIVSHQETWYDGISYFDVGGDGKIFQHVADKVMEDKDRSLDDKPGGGRALPFAKLGGALSATGAVFPSTSLNYQEASSTSQSSTDNSSSAAGDKGGGGANLAKS